MRRSEREYQDSRLRNDSGFSIGYGSVDRKRPEVIYVNYKTYLASKEDDEDYNMIVNKVLRGFKKFISKTISKSRFKNQFIYDYDILQDIQSTFKNKILTFDLYLKQPNESIMKLSHIKPYIEEISKELTDELSDKLHVNKIELSKVKVS